MQSQQQNPRRPKQGKGRKNQNRNRNQNGPYNAQFGPEDIAYGNYPHAPPAAARRVDQMPCLHQQTQPELVKSNGSGEGKPQGSFHYQQQLANPSHQSWRPKGPHDILVFLDLTKFKTQPCPFAKQQGSKQHNPKRCFYFHDFKKDRRRVLGTYTSEMCPDVQSSHTKYTCPRGDACLKAHNRVEEFYHPEKYKSKFCKSYPHSMEGCDYGEMCAFAHSEDEISIDLLHKMEPKDADFYMFYFKTVWCPWSADHDKENCVYAHNWQDLRRKPHLYSYGRDLCQNWQIENFIRTYGEGCCKEYRCTFSHGWKEQQYHPRSYKLLPCKSGGKCRKHHCPYFHNETDRRMPLDPNFILMPRNRGNNFSLMNPHLNQYKSVFIDVMQNEQDRLLAAQQTVYGCGPQSVPAIDPFLLGIFQAMEQQKRAQPPSPPRLTAPPQQKADSNLESKTMRHQQEDLGQVLPMHQGDEKDCVFSQNPSKSPSMFSSQLNDLAAQQRALQQLQEFNEMKQKIDASYNYIQAVEREKYIMQNIRHQPPNESTASFQARSSSYDLNKSSDLPSESTPQVSSSLPSSVAPGSLAQHHQLPLPLPMSFNVGSLPNPLPGHDALDLNSKYADRVSAHTHTDVQHPPTFLPLMATRQSFNEEQQMGFGLPSGDPVPLGKQASIFSNSSLTQEPAHGEAPNQNIFNSSHFNEFRSQSAANFQTDSHCKLKEKAHSIHHTEEFNAAQELISGPDLKTQATNDVQVQRAAIIPRQKSMLNTIGGYDNPLFYQDLSKVDHSGIGKPSSIKNQIRPGSTLRSSLFHQQQRISKENMTQQSSGCHENSVLHKQTMNTLKKSMNDILKEVQAGDSSEEVECFCNKFESPRSRSKEKNPMMLFYKNPMLTDEGVKEEIDQEDLNDSVMDPASGLRTSSNDIFGRLKPHKKAFITLKSSDNEEEGKYLDHDVDFLVAKPDVSDESDAPCDEVSNPKMSFGCGSRPTESRPQQRTSGCQARMIEEIREQIKQEKKKKLTKSGVKSSLASDVRQSNASQHSVASQNNFFVQSPSLMASNPTDLQHEAASKHIQELLTLVQSAKNSGASLMGTPNGATLQSPLLQTTQLVGSVGSTVHASAQSPLPKAADISQLGLTLDSKLPSARIQQLFSQSPKAAPEGLSYLNGEQPESLAAHFGQQPSSATQAPETLGLQKGDVDPQQRSDDQSALPAAAGSAEPPKPDSHPDAYRWYRRRERTCSFDCERSRSRDAGSER